MSHADSVREAKDGLVEKVLEFCEPPASEAWRQGDELSALGAERLTSVEAQANCYRAFLAATCETCGGRGFVGCGCGQTDCPYEDPCPSNCDDGRRAGA